MPIAAAIDEAILRMLAARAPDASICPSEVVRSLHDGEAAWRDSMPRVRAAARRMAGEGVLVITQGERVVDPQAPLRGAIRLRRGPAFRAP